VRRITDVGAVEALDVSRLASIGSIDRALGVGQLDSAEASGLGGAASGRAVETGAEHLRAIAQHDRSRATEDHSPTRGCLCQQDFLRRPPEVVVDRQLRGERDRRAYVLADEPAQDALESRGARLPLAVLHVVTLGRGDINAQPFRDSKWNRAVQEWNAEPLRQRRSDPATTGTERR
jgi:hypothetical protein